MAATADTRAVAPAKGQAEIVALIAALASPNREPPWGRDNADHYDPPAYPPDFDHSAQGRVYEARTALIAQGMAAFAALVSSADDGRYCYTRHGGGGWANMTVGQTCRQIIQLQVEVCQRYEWHRRSGHPGNTYYLLAGPYGTDLAKWWAATKHLSLREMQLEATKWVIKLERKRNFRFPQERAAVLGDLERLRKRLESSDRPIIVDGDGEFVNEQGLEPTEWKP